MNETYNLFCDGKLIGTATSFTDACQLAKSQSLVLGGVTRVRDGKETKGRIVSVWSGPWTPGTGYPYGVTKHVSYCCGSSQ
jgi:hypothetical protein